MILQWNCRGFYRNLEELKLLVNRYNPKIVCLQETNFREKDIPKLKGFRAYRRDFLLGNRACGGVVIFVRNDIYCENDVSILSDIQMIHLTVYIPTKITVCNIYLPPAIPVTKGELTRHIRALPAPYVIVGDFNAHHTMWGSTHVSPRGRMLEDILVKENIALINKQEFTHFNSSNGSLSAIDLAFSSPSLLPLLDWTVHRDLCGSDHFPIMISCANQDANLSVVPRWSLKRAQWEKFASMANFRDQEFNNIDEEAEYITKVLVDAAETSIPKTSVTLKKTPAPWWNGECKNAIKNRKKALRQFYNQASEENLAKYKILRSKARRIIKESRKESWRQFVSTISQSTPSSEIWKKIKAIIGVRSTTQIPGLNINGSVKTEDLDKAELFAEAFAKVSGSDKYPNDFLSIKLEEENQAIDFSEEGCNQNYNIPFKMWELERSLSKSKNTSPGPDNVHYKFLQNLTQQNKIYLLRFYNRIWSGRQFPKAWSVAITIPIAKEGKDKSMPESYRPITLSSCLCKTLERM
uniref:Endo/exonuclease/phosphatase domain-containing protein n=1 Tax=Rhodnius prolixus TaxID=13249 RepID=T1I2R8_RHOPR